jgi:hypothetical protein
MFSKFDKAYAAALVSFISLTAANFFGVEVSPEMQAALVGLISGAVTWLVPNKA